MREFLLLLFISCSFVLRLGATDRDSLLDARIDDALQRGLLWLVEDPDHFKPETFIVYNYLERKFNAPPVCNYEEFLEKAKLNQKRYQAIYPFLRFVKPDHTITAEDFAEIDNPTNVVMAEALWCDKFKLPENHLEKLENHLYLGSYKMTHVYFGLQFLKEHKHPICKTKEFERLEKESERFLKEFIRDHPYPEDLTIEALAFLTLTDKAEGYLTREVIEQILDIQLESGAWNYSKERKREEQHTVILAMWLLYEYRYPDAPNITWLQLTNKN